MNIKVIGYYKQKHNNHNNTGDEQYKITISKLLENYDLDFIDCDNIMNIVFNPDDIIIFGGGNVLCDYFVDKLLSVFQNTNHKIIALSVDIPFIDILLKTNKLDRLDFIFLRNYQDFILFSKFYNPNKIAYIPDVSCLLTGVPYNSLLPIRTLEPLRHIRKNIKIACITLCNNDIIYDICNFIIYLITCNYYIVLIPFDKVEDTKTHNTLANLLTDYSDSLINLPFSHCLETFCKIKQVDIVFSMRFHGCLFAMYNKIPFIALNNSRKIQNLLKDTKWKFTAYNEDFKFSYAKLMASFHKIHDSMDELIFPSFTIDINQFNQDFNQVIQEPKIIIQSTNILNLSEKINYLKINYDYETIVKYLSYLITDNMNSGYNYGILEKIKKSNYNFVDEISWVIDDYFKNTIYNMSKESPQMPNFNITYKNQDDTSGVHRSGWKYVYDNLLKFNNRYSDTLLDLYVDETFHWNHDVYKILEIIPYTQNWYGFIHHTFDESFSEYNCKNLLKNEDFITSLIYCKGLIVLSNYLRDQLEHELLKIGFKIPVYTIYHPTASTHITFSMSKFIENKHKKILNIGTWLRNIYSFYKLKINLSDRSFISRLNYLLRRHNYTIKKAVLMGKHGSNYFPSDNFLKDLKQFLISEQVHNKDDSHHTSHHILKNNWYMHLFDDLKKDIKSVELIDFKENQDYDLLLSENIVFTHIVDGSGLNTLIECIIRNTPIVINPHPAVVELLGPKYPLYFSEEDILNLTLKKIKKAHKYLKNLDKSRLDINFFISALNTIIGDN